MALGKRGKADLRNTEYTSLISQDNVDPFALVA
jgi:hypothetical protein